MLKQCLRNLKKWKCEAELFLANAEELPFRDESFDEVFHLGGMNLFRFEQI
jgi:ubiquinone/menaquinone biosynthesis C-methylase UbiE